MSVVTCTFMKGKAHHRMKGIIFITPIIWNRRKIPTIIVSNRKIQYMVTSAQTEKPDLNYASLDLKVANKHKKKHRHQQGHAQGRNKLQDQLPVRLTPPTNTFLEVEADIDAQLPSRDTSIAVSYNSIYLNSHQIAQETEDMERGRGMNMCWDGMRSQEDGGSRDWKGEHESEERRDRQDYGNGSVCTQLSQAEAIERTDDFTSSFSHDSVQQD
ncbi:uncharacterized protein V6R79_014129 [Siganus canaliculatus]